MRADHDPSTSGRGGVSKGARGGGMKQVDRTRHARHLGREILANDGGVRPIALVVALETIRDVRSCAAKDVLETEPLHLGNPPRPHQLPTHAVAILSLSLQHEDVRTCPRHHRRERAAGDATADHDEIGVVHAGSLGPIASSVQPQRSIGGTSVRGRSWRVPLAALLPRDDRHLLRQAPGSTRA